METKMISAGEALDWMMSNPNQVIEDDTDTSWQFSAIRNRIQRLDSGDWLADYFGPVEASRKFKLPIAPEPASATPATTMTPGQALDWMIEHPGKELVDDNGYVYRLFNMLSLHRTLNRDGCTVPLSAILGHTFRIPERVLPKLPEGCEWRSADTKTPFVFRLAPGVSYGSAADQTDRDINAALVEEFDTRPK